MITAMLRNWHCCVECRHRNYCCSSDRIAMNFRCALIITFSLLGLGCSETPSGARLIREVGKTLGDYSPTVQQETVEAFPDFSYYAKAPMSRDEYLQACNKLKINADFSQKLDNAVKRRVTWRVRDAAPKWWNPSTERKGTRFLLSGDLCVIVKHEKGHMFVFAYTH